MDPSTGRPLKGVLRHVELPPSGPVTELASLAQKRRDDRLLDKRILQRCVSNLSLPTAGGTLTSLRVCGRVYA